MTSLLSDPTAGKGLQRRRSHSALLLRGVERRIAAGLNSAVASLCVSRRDVAVAGKVPGEQISGEDECGP